MDKLVVAVINYKDEVVLAKRKIDSKKALAGLWHVPGENLEEGELDEEGLIRCAKNDLGLEIKVGIFIAETISLDGKKANWYECFSESNVLHPNANLEDARWVRKDYVPKLCKERSKYWPKELINYFKR